MKTVHIFEENETVMIKAKISRVYFDKDKISYELKDYITDQAFLNRFSEKDITPFEEEERSSYGNNTEGTDREVVTSSRLANGDGYGPTSHP